MGTTGREHERLDVLVGVWKTEGWTRETPGTPPERIDATDTYEWLPDGFALLHSMDAHVGDRKRLVEKVRMLERWTAPSEDRPAAIEEETRTRASLLSSSLRA
jgi:hypothetical protein